MRKFISRLVVAVLLVLSASYASAQSTCVQTQTVTGNVGGGNSPVSVTLNPICQGTGTVTGISIDGITTGACGIKWFTRIYVNGNLITNPSPLGCGFTSLSLNSYLPITSVTYEADSYELIPWSAQIQLNMTVTYNNITCTGTPSAGNATSSDFVVCAGDSFDLSLNNASSTVGLTYQWQSSSDNTNWTNIANATSANYSTDQTGSTYYRCAVSCSGNTDHSTSYFVETGHCTPVTDTICNTTSGQGVEVIPVAGWIGAPTTDAIIEFKYHGALNQSAAYLTVTDLAGNFIGQLDGSQLFCGDFTDKILLPQSMLTTLLAQGSGIVNLKVTASNQVGAWCPSSTGGPNISFCITAKIKAGTHIYADDASVNGIVTPSLNSCVLDSNVTISLFNSGSNALTSATLNWSVNGVAQTPVSWTGNIPAFTTDTVSLAQYTGGFNNFDSLVIWSSLPNGSVDSNTFADTTARVLHEALNGTYTIDIGGNGDFASFNSAVSTMEQYGLCGPVTFAVNPGTFVEQVTIDCDNIGGLDSNNTVTFTSANGNASSAVLTYAPVTSGENYTIKLVNARYLNFYKISLKSIGTNYQRVVWSESTSITEDISFDQCILEGPVTNSTSGVKYIMYLQGSTESSSFTNNHFLNGSSGIYLGSSSSSVGDSNVVSNNHFENQSYSSLHLRYQNNLTVTGNKVTSSQTASNTSGSYGMYLSYVYGSGEISNNHMEGNMFWPRYGVYTYQVQGDSTNPYKFYNNRIHTPANTTRFAFYNLQMENVEVIHNSIYKGSNPNYQYDAAFYFSNGANIVAKNNIIQSVGDGIGYQVNGNPMIESDYNNISVTGGGVFAVNNGDTLSTLTMWTDSTQLDSNSLTVHMIYSDTAALRVCTDSLQHMGVGVAGYNYDFEGDPRAATPCIGADEFMPLSQFGFNNSPEICTGDTLVLEQYYFETVVWWPTLDTGNVLVVTTPGSYGVAVYGGCGSDTSMFNVIPQKNATVNDTNLCEGTSAYLSTGIINGTYVWSDGSTDSTLLVDSAQVVSVTVVSEWGCTSSDTAIVTQSYDVALPDSASFCEGSSVILDAAMVGNYVWSDGSTGQILSVNVPGTYSVTVTDMNCISSDSTVVEEILDPVPSFTDSIDNATVYFTNTTDHATSYHWDFGDGNTSIQMNPTHTYSPSGSIWSYTVILTASNVCADEEYTTTVTNEPAGIGEYGTISSLKVFPNPNNGAFTVQVNSDEVAEMNIRVMDARGALVYNQNYGTVQGEVNQEINLNELAKGIYLVNVTLGNKNAVYRMTVK